MAKSPAQRQAERQRKREQKQNQREKQARENARGDFQKGLEELGLHGHYRAIIDKAVREGWDTGEFWRHVAGSKIFQAQYPGLMHGGGVADYLRSVGATDIPTAVRAYESLAYHYGKVLSNYQGMNLTGAHMAALLQNGISADELGTRIAAVQTAKANPMLLDTYNQELVAAGMKPITDPQDFWKLIAGAADKPFYDVYEAAQLRAAGIDTGGAQGAYELAQGLGQQGVPTNLNDIIRQVNTYKSDILPELKAAGISESDITLYASGSDPRGIGPQLQSILASRHAQRAQPRNQLSLGQSQPDLAID